MPDDMVEAHLRGVNNALAAVHSLRENQGLTGLEQPAVGAVPKRRINESFYVESKI